MNGYVLTEEELADGITVLCLSSTTANGSFISKWMMSPKQHESFDNFTAVIRKIQERGPSDMIRSKKLRVIDGNLNLYEIKNFQKAQRVMAVIEGDIVLLLRYEAHKGGNDNNDPKIMKRARKAAEIAHALLEKEREENGN